MSASDAGATGPRVLFVYFTYTQQSLKVAEAMAEVLRERGCDVRLAAIELTDARYAERFTRFPLRHAYLDIVGMMPAQVRGATGEIRIPDDARDGALRPGRYRVAYVVDKDQRSDSLVAEVRCGGTSAAGHALRCVRRVPAVLGLQLESGEEARHRKRGRVRRRDSFLVRRRPGSVAAVVDQLFRQWREPGALSGREDPSDQSDTGLRRAGSNVRVRVG